jgi:hypothetical protein
VGHNGLDAVVEDLMLKYEKMVHEMPWKGQRERLIVDNFLQNTNLPFPNRVMRFHYLKSSRFHISKRIVETKIWSITWRIIEPI